MTWKEIYPHLLNGKKIKRSHWLGNWKLENNKLMIYAKDTSPILFRDVDDMMFALRQMTEEDWEVIE